MLQYDTSFKAATHFHQAMRMYLSSVFGQSFGNEVTVELIRILSESGNSRKTDEELGDILSQRCVSMGPEHLEVSHLYVMSARALLAKTAMQYSLTKDEITQRFNDLLQDLIQDS